MNVYWFELRREWKNAAVWTAVLLVLLGVLLLSVYPIYYDGRTQVLAALEGFPPQFAAAFGLNIETIFSFGGFYAFSFLYLAVLGAVFASGLGLLVFAREKRAKCDDFLLTKPRPRTALFAAKGLAALTLLVLQNLLYIVLFLAICNATPQAAAPLGNQLAAALALLLTQLVFFAAGVCIAVFAQKVRTVSGTAMAVAFGGFLLTALQSILKEEALRYLSPYQYFDAALAFETGHFETAMAVTASLLTVALLAAAFVKYRTGQTHAV